MLRNLMILAMVSVLVASCSFVNRTFTNREYRKNGYRISSPEGTFVYQTDPVKRKLEVEYGYETRTYLDTDGDNQVDRVEYQDETYERGEPGTGKIFEQADRTWAEKRELLNVPEVHEKWKRMSASERLAERNYFQN